LLERIDYITDRTSDNGAVSVNGTEKPLVGIERLLDLGVEMVLLISEIRGLNDLTFILLSRFCERLRDTVFYAGGFLMHNPPDYSLPEYDPGAKRLIPKTLHYCWFGRNPLPPLMKRCVESWKKFCPDFDIVEWNEDNFDVNQNRYVREAYGAKKWAFVSDFARMDVIYRCGGVYMDTDVEAVKPLDRFLNDPAFCGMEEAGAPVLSTTFGAAAGNELVRVFRGIYEAIPFMKANGEYDCTPCTRYHSVAFQKLGIVKENKIQNAGGFTVYPTDVFSPLSSNLVYEGFTDNSHAVHHFTGSWHTNKENEEKIRDVIEYRRMMEGLHNGELYKTRLLRYI
jgi:hypothetical protein